MDEKLVSVIIPAYNIEDYIGRCLDSIISQTYKNLEIIVVDDGSRDHTGEILDNYAKKDRRIKVIHKENGGVSSARNKGIEAAEGDYIGFIDGDDLIEPEMYKTLVDLLEEENADIAHCGYQMVFPDRVDYYHNTGKKKIQTTEEGLKDLLSGEMIEPGLVNKLYKKELIKNCRLDETVKINEDLLMNFEKKFEVFWKFFIDNGGYNVVIEGLRNTLIIAILGLVIGIIIGTLIATVRVVPKTSGVSKVLDVLAKFYVSFFRGTPIVVQLLLFYYVLMPLLSINLKSVPVAVIVFGLNSGAYISEIMRAGILSVDPGQMEGGRAVGLSYGTTMMKIVIPQAVKNILPTLGNEFISLIKETSVVSFVGATDLYLAFQRIGSNTYDFMVPYLVMAVIYIVMVFIISTLIKVMERSLRKSDYR